MKLVLAVVLAVPVAAHAQPGADDPDTLEDEAPVDPTDVEPLPPPVVATAITSPSKRTARVITPRVMPPVLAADPTRREIDGEVERSWNAGVVMTGAVAFGLAYGSGGVLAGTTERGAYDRLYVPVAGPWLALGALDDDDPTVTTTTKLLLVGDGIVQAAGVAGM